MSIERRGRFELEQMSTDDLDELRIWLDTYREDVAKALANRGGLFLRAYHPDFKIEVIKAIRGITGLGLKEAKYLSEAPQPVCVRAGTDWVDLARKFVNDLENVAVIEWRQPYDTVYLPLRQA